MVFALSSAPIVLLDSVAKSSRPVVLRGAPLRAKVFKVRPVRVLRELLLCLR